MTGIPPSDESASPSRLILFQGEDRVTRIQVRLEGGTVWLTQAQLAELYQTSLQNVSAHLQDIYSSGELVEGATIKDYLIVRTEGARQVRRSIQHYNLDAILAVGYRVRSHRGVQFRQWATAQLREFVVKGFVLDDERLKAPPGDADEDYFAQLLDRIRDIRSSERLFYRKVLDIYATSVDYDPSAESSQRFFATVQNKMHWAAHGHTAAEVIHERADASKPHMGLSHVPRGARVRKQDVSVAKNYLHADELEALNRIVNAYLEFAELQARGRRLMYMQDWIAKLDDFLRLSDRDILTHAGTVSHEMAQLKAETEYDAYRARTDAEPRAVDGDFEEAVKRLPRQRRRPSDTGGE